MRTKHFIGVLGLSALGLTSVTLSQPAQAKTAHTTAKPAMAKTMPGSHKINSTQARRIALKAYPGTVVGRAKQENEGGKLQYAVNVKSGKTLREIMVGVESGKIEKVEVTTPAQEKAEMKAETKMATKTKPHTMASHSTVSHKSMSSSTMMAPKSGAKMMTKSH